jgi:hypothetical protein
MVALMFGEENAVATSRPSPQPPGCPLGREAGGSELLVESAECASKTSSYLTASGQECSEVSEERRTIRTEEV